ncbi:winged helix-turn-helix transcriptional regulator [Gemmobacter denitrificans]|uniref:Helix-turn-helix domain-containing protein n=1 Tax=Gemmobacter denitrificans TaxID=3123040 RepID=A0ABU8BRU6_9RHOB
MSLRVRKNRSQPPPETCALGDCLTLIGGAWTPNILWYLAAGPRRFSELKGDLRPVTARVLTRRLRELEEDGVIRRQVMPTSPPSVEYGLTDFGQDLLPAIRAIVAVGERIKQRRAGLAVAGETAIVPAVLPEGARHETDLRPERAEPEPAGAATA